MKESYKSRLALPSGVGFDVVWEADTDVDQSGVNSYVNTLKRPGWYRSDTGRNTLDTQLYMLEVRQPFQAIEIMGKLTRAWICDCCQNPVLYEGVQLGHITDWKTELKTAGVKSASEAKAAYNNLRNLRIECSTCNSSHDNEGNSDTD